jgi:predicted methyltransferase MtxX (methanogen marker protein 4)
MASAGGTDDLGKEKEGGNSTIDGGFIEKFKKMVLTEKYKKVLVMEDLEDEEGEQITVVGKIMSPTKFYIQTIISALRPQWGNPKGLEFKAMGDTVFMATLDREQDRNAFGKVRHG